MAASTTVTIQATTTGIQVGTKGPLSLTITGTTDEAVAASITQTTLASGFNSIPVPNIQAQGVIIVPASASTVTKTLKGVTGDTGIRMDNTSPFLLTFEQGSAPATIGITASAADTGLVTEFWWF